MTVEWVKALAEVLHAILWPIVVLLIVFSFKQPLIDIFTHSDKTSLKLPGGIELSVSQVAESAAAAGAALGKQSAEQQQPVSQLAVKNIAKALASPQAGSAKALNDGRILWVDDVPSNNVSLINAFQTLGIKVFQATSTDQAKTMLASSTYDLIISDMSRPPDNEAGLTLIRFLKTSNYNIPVIIFAARWAYEHQGQEQEIGAAAITNDSSVVYSEALKIITSSSGSSIH